MDYSKEAPHSNRDNISPGTDWLSKLLKLENIASD